MLPYPRNSPNRGSLDDYDIREKVGEGTYGHVYRAIHKPTRKFVALKRVLDFPEEDGIPFTSMREIKYLKQLQKAKHIIQLTDTFFTKGVVFCCLFPTLSLFPLFCVRIALSLRETVNEF